MVLAKIKIAVLYFFVCIVDNRKNTDKLPCLISTCMIKDIQQKFGLVLSPNFRINKLSEYFRAFGYGRFTVDAGKTYGINFQSGGDLINLPINNLGFT